MTEVETPGPLRTVTGAEDSATMSGTPLLPVAQARVTFRFSCLVPVGSDADACRSIIVRIVLLRELLQHPEVREMEPAQAALFVRRKLYPEDELASPPIVALDVGAVRHVESLWVPETLAGRFRKFMAGSSSPSGSMSPCWR